MVKINQQKLDEQLYNAYYYYDLPGLAAGIGSGNLGMEYAKTYGVKNVNTKETIRENDIFHMASLAKLFTGTGILQFWEKERLDLDIPITHYLSWFQMRDSIAQSITIRQLLTHTSAMPDISDYHWDHPQIERDALKNYFMSQELRQASLLWSPQDQKFSYSNIGYDLLGLILSQVSGDSFENIMDKNIFQPLKMTDTTFFTPIRDLSKICAPHKKNRAKQTEPLKHYPYNRIHAPSSTLTSNIDDIGKWGVAHLKQQLFQPKTYQMAWEEFATVPNNGEKICLSWFKREQNGYTLYGHEGADEGFRSSFWLCPELDVFIVLCANISNAPLKKLSKEIFAGIIQ